MIKGELTVRKFKEKGGQGLVGEYTRTVKVKPGPARIEGYYLSAKDRMSGVPARVQSDNNRKLSCYLIGDQGPIGFHFYFSPVDTSNHYVQVGMFVSDGKFAPFWSCSFHKTKESKLQALGRKIREIIRA